MRIAVVSKYVTRQADRPRIEGVLGKSHEYTYFGVFSIHSEAESKAIQKARRAEISDLFDELEPDAVLALGNEALYVTTGHSGIMKWRGKMTRNVMPTIALGAVERNPAQAPILQADLQALMRYLTGDEVAGTKPDRIRVAKDKKSLIALKSDLTGAHEVAFDLETTGFDERAEDAAIISLALTVRTASGVKECWAVPLAHRASRWSAVWEKVVQKIASWTRPVPVRIAHNGKFDCRWLAQFKAPVPCNYDTMLAAHLVDENRSKGLKELAQMLLGADPWDINISSRKNGPPWYETIPLKDILKYNALDTWHTFRLYDLFLMDERTERLFRKLVMPASQSLVSIERRGVYVDSDRLLSGAQRVDQELERIHQGLLEHVPDETPYPVNFNPSSFLRWWLFEYLELPVLKEGKTGPSTAEDVLSHLADKHPVVPLLLERVKWNKFKTSFFNPYQELITSQSRIHTTFKLSGTVTGRLSSGKADAGKVTGSRQVRGVNLQQVPRDTLVRGIFGAPPGWTFVEADYSQIELRIAAEIAREKTMLDLYRNGQDIHTTMAMRMTNKPAGEISKEERKAAKAVNFGFLYGMGWRKFIDTAWNNYGLEVTEQESQAFRKAFFDQFPDLQRWHQKQRRLAHQYKRVQSPLGRIRHLPGVDSKDEGVVAEAERQSINSPVQATASDLCLLSLVLLDREFRKRKLRAKPIGTVHDAINFEIPDEELPVALPLIKDRMEHPPTFRLFGYGFIVPIVSDIAIGKHWGGATEIPGDIVNDPDQLQNYLTKENWK